MVSHQLDPERRLRELGGLDAGRIWEMVSPCFSDTHLIERKMEKMQTCAALFVYEIGSSQVSFSCPPGGRIDGAPRVQAEAYSIHRFRIAEMETTDTRSSD